MSDATIRVGASEWSRKYYIQAASALGSAVYQTALPLIDVAFFGASIGTILYAGDVILANDLPGAADAALNLCKQAVEKAHFPSQSVNHAQSRLYDPASAFD